MHCNTSLESQRIQDQGVQPWALTKFPDFSLTFPWPFCGFPWPWDILSAFHYCLNTNFASNLTNHSPKVAIMIIISIRQIIKMQKCFKLSQDCAQWQPSELNTLEGQTVLWFLIIFHYLDCTKCKFPDFSLTFPNIHFFPDLQQNSLTFLWLLPSLEFPWLFPDRWTPWRSLDLIFISNWDFNFWRRVFLQWHITYLSCFENILYGVVKDFLISCLHLQVFRWRGNPIIQFSHKAVLLWQIRWKLDPISQSFTT